MDWMFEVDVYLCTDGVRLASPECLEPGGLPGGQPDEDGARLFVALFSYDPAVMSPNPETAEEELPFREGQVIKVLRARSSKYCATGAGMTEGVAGAITSISDKLNKCSDLRNTQISLTPERFKKYLHSISG